VTSEASNTILVVDDEWMNRELLQAHLESAGYGVLLAANGTKALEIAAHEEVDLILMDVRMPGMNGYEVCVQLKTQPATSHIPVIILTGLDDDEYKLKALEAGADDFISKPFDSVVMMARIRSLLRIKTLHDELDRREQALWNVLNRYVDEDSARLIMDDLAQH
jgi:two-component system cell cycle response regulator